MELNYEILQKALNDMKEIHGITRMEVTEASKVHNIQKIITGAIKPLPDSWWKLHKAFPEYIPQPTYTDGGLVYSAANQTVTGNENQTASHHSRITTIAPKKAKLEPIYQVLVDALDKLPRDERDKKIYEFLGGLAG